MTTRDWVDGLKVVELKEELKKRGESVSGVKAVLADRLWKAISEATDKGDAQPEGNKEDAEAEQDEAQQDGKGATATGAAPEPPVAEAAAADLPHATPDQGDADMGERAEHASTAEAPPLATGPASPPEQQQKQQEDQHEQQHAAEPHAAPEPHAQPAVAAEQPAAPAAEQPPQPAPAAPSKALVSDLEEPMSIGQLIGEDDAQEEQAADMDSDQQEQQQQQEPEQEQRQEKQQQQQPEQREQQEQQRQPEAAKMDLRAIIAERQRKGAVAASKEAEMAKEAEDKPHAGGGATPAAAVAEGRKGEEDGKSDRKAKRQPINFQPPERKTSLQPSQSAQLQDAAAGATVASPRAGNSLPAAAAAAAAAAPASRAEPASASAASNKEPQQQEQSAAKRPKVDLPDTGKGSSAAAAPEKGAGAAPTRCLCVDGLVRPFTEAALRALLGATGVVVDLWMPMLKTHALVTFESEEQAEATRQATHLLKWPQGSPKVLQPRFVTPEDVAREKAGGAAAGATPRGVSGAPGRVGIISAIKASQLPPGRSPVGNNLAAAAAAAAAADAKAAGPARAKTLEAKEPAAAGKQGGKGREGEGADEEAAQAPDVEMAEMGAQQAAAAAAAGKEVQEEGGEMVLRLDDLFRKTKAKPPLYYLPHSEQHVQERRQKAAEGRAAREARAAEAEAAEAAAAAAGAGARRTREDEPLGVGGGRGARGGGEREGNWDRKRSRSRDRGDRR